MVRTPALLALLMLALSQPVSAASKDDVATIRQCLADASDAPPRSCIGQISTACQETPDEETNGNVDACLEREGDAWDVMLNEAYKATTASAKSLDRDRKADGDEEASAAADLLKAQRAWIAYRDAECDRRYEVSKDGTIRTTMTLDCTLDLTALRAIDLQSEE